MHFNFFNFLLVETFDIDTVSDLCTNVCKEKGNKIRI